MAEAGVYKRSLGLFELVSLGVGGTIGSGIFVVPGVAAKLSGPWSLLAWLIVALSASCVLLSLAYVSFRFTSSNGFYSLFTSVFGARFAVPLIILYLISSLFGVSTIAAGIGQYISYFGISNVLLIEIAIIGAFCWLNISGISLSGMTENILTTLKIIPLVIIAFLLIPLINIDNFVPRTPVTYTGLLATIIIVYWPFTGFEISAILVEETRDPKIIRRSLILVMVIVVSVYLLLNVSLIGSVGAEALGASPAPIATAAAVLFNRSGSFVAIIGIVAMLSAINAYIIGTSRILQSMSAWFSVPKIQNLTPQGTPKSALIAGCAISAALLLFSNHFDQLATISVITILIPYIFFCLCSWVLVTDTRSRLVSAAGAISTAAILVIYFII
ncbi:MAG TPA: APC family permease [Methanoregula sp.]|nr:APC family permease [Methanoregula sp.]